MAFSLSLPTFSSACLSSSSLCTSVLFSLLWQPLKEQGMCWGWVWPEKKRGDCCLRALLRLCFSSQSWCHYMGERWFCILGAAAVTRSWCVWVAVWYLCLECLFELGTEHHVKNTLSMYTSCLIRFHLHLILFVFTVSSFVFHCSQFLSRLVSFPPAVLSAAPVMCVCYCVYVCLHFWDRIYSEASPAPVCQACLEKNYGSPVSGSEKVGRGHSKVVTFGGVTEIGHPVDSVKSSEGEETELLRRLLSKATVAMPTIGLGSQLSGQERRYG